MIRLLLALALLLPALAARGDAAPELSWYTAMRTGAPWSAAIDFQTDAVLLENITPDYAERVRFYDMQGYAVYAMFPPLADMTLYTALQPALKTGLRGIVVPGEAWPELIDELKIAAQAAGVAFEILTPRDYAAIEATPQSGEGLAFGRAWRNELARALATQPRRILLFQHPERYMAANDGSAAWADRLDAAVAEQQLAVANAVAQALRDPAPAGAATDGLRRGALRVYPNATQAEATQQLPAPAIDLLSPTLAIRSQVAIPAGDTAYVLDFAPQGAAALAGTTRLRPPPRPRNPRNTATADRRLMGQMRAPAGTEGRIRVWLPSPPGFTVFHWNPTEVLDTTTEWDAATSTVLFRFQNMGLRQFTEINW